MKVNIQKDTKRTEITTHSVNVLAVDCSAKEMFSNQIIKMT